MANTIQKFTNSQFGEIRGMNINGDAWLMATDVARRLGYTNPQKAIRDHVDDEDKTLNESFTVNGTTPILINESGLYSMILSSKLPQARVFKRWVTSEVLPRIRKTGGYIPVEKQDDDTTILAKAVGILQRTVALKNQQLAEQGEIISELAPDAAYAQQVLLAPGCYTMTEVAKGLSMTVQELQHKLMKKGIIFRAPSGMFMLYAPFQKHGYEAYRTDRSSPETQDVHTDSYLVWTELGRQFIHSIM